MQTFKKIIFVAIIFIISCSGNNERIQEMCREVNLAIQTDNCTEIKNEYDGAGADYSISIILKLDISNLNYVTKQIITSPYFNKPTTNDVNSKYTKLLKDINRRGIWKRNKIGFEFVDYGKNDEPVTAVIDTNTGILQYTFVHL